ncbi:hypothetical protein ACI48D_25640 [Massilia sp. LXY-6]|uniref:hypothetical protein n=1 Tax=Massilia sp. LXY-6 TaxID=3379823 RepID=UPI003EDF55BE
MKKENYLRDPAVTSFVEWMGQNLQADSRLGHGYTRPRQAPLRFRNLGDAFEQYAWAFNFKRIDGDRCSGSTFTESEAVLGDLQRQLRAALKAGSDATVCNAAIEVVRWGGVARRNEEWLRARQSGLAELLGKVKTALETHDDAADFGPELRFNAGMTKVYSLLLDHFVIYDSRVAAALAWFVVEWARERGQEPDAIPPALQFACMTANEGPNVAQPKCRNPRPGVLYFPYLRNRPYVHVLWNLRASWIVE